MKKYMHLAVVLVLALAASALLFTPTAEAARGFGNAVYTMTNDADKNAVVMFSRDGEGILREGIAYPTGGQGTGAGLGNQGGLVFSERHRLLFAVNAGSDQISVFEMRPFRLILRQVVDSAGDMPISLTVHGDLLFVLNAGGDGNIAGFRIGKGGALDLVPTSIKPLSGAGVGPAQIGFHPDGGWLLVTEKSTHLISVYKVDEAGVTFGPVSQPSSGMTPFGFAFDLQGFLMVTEAFGGAEGASAVSSYRLRPDGILEVVSASVPNHQTASCWLAIHPTVFQGFTTNTGSDNLSAYLIAPTGALSLVQTNGIAALTGEESRPIDLSFTLDGQFLYALNSGTGAIDGFRVGLDGSLTPIGGVGGLPHGANGLVAR